MPLPLQGTISRRILVNHRAPLDALADLVPAPLRPKPLPGRPDHGMVGVCLIRLEQLRPPGVPRALGVASENAAHRIAVEWDADGARRHGVFITRRDSAARTAQWAGRLVHTHHHPATMSVEDDGRNIALHLASHDGKVDVHVKGDTATAMPPYSAFGSLPEASEFFEQGCDGFSQTPSGRLVGIRLVTEAWSVQPFRVTEARSSYLEEGLGLDRREAPFDCALLMRDVAHRWEPVRDVPRA